MNRPAKSWHDHAATAIVAFFCLSSVMSLLAFYVVPWLIAAWFVSELAR